MPRPPPEARHRSDAWKAAALVTTTWFTVPFMDGIAKHLSAEFPIVQIVWARFFFHFLLVTPVALYRHGRHCFTIPRPGLQLARGACLTCATILFFGALRYIPLANAVSLIFLSPILIALLSGIVLKEKVPPDRWIAVIIGFIAVLVIVRPGFESFHWASLMALGTAVVFTLYLLSTSMLTGTAPPLVTLAWQSVSGTVVLSLLMPFVWHPPAPGVFLAMMSLGLIAAFGHFTLIKSFEYADASFLAPFNYLEIVMATVIGYYWFGDLPDTWTWFGITTIILTALYITVPRRR